MLEYLIVSVEDVHNLIDLAVIVKLWHEQKDEYSTLVVQIVVLVDNFCKLPT